MAHRQSDSGRNYAYRGIDVDAFLDSSLPSHAEDTTWSSLVGAIRDVVLQFVRTSSVNGWQTFPTASYDISTSVSNATIPRYLSKKCTYWREHGFFPAYAWMNWSEQFFHCHAVCIGLHGQTHQHCTYAFIIVFIIICCGLTVAHFFFNILSVTAVFLTSKDEFWVSADWIPVKYWNPVVAFCQMFPLCQT